MANFDYFGLGGVIKRYDLTDKQKCTRAYINYMMLRLQSMFRYENLPETIPQKMLELYIMVNGHSVVVEHDGDLYVCFGGWGGEPDEYYLPQQYIVANPYLKLFKTYTIGKDCVLVRNDSLYYGMLPLVSRYATMMVENDITMNMQTINGRIVTLFDAPDDKSKASADEFISNVEKGKLGAMASTRFLDGIKTMPYGNAGMAHLTDSIEYHQYLKASFYNEIGLNANYNMKREAINSNESQLNDDMLLPLIDDMLKNRKDFVKEINDMFGTDITVDFASSWEDNQQELEKMQEEIGGEQDNETSEMESERDLPESD